MNILKHTILLLLTFVLNLPIQSQTSPSFDELYQQGIDLVSSNKDSAKVLFDSLNFHSSELTPLKQAKLHYYKIKLFNIRKYKDTTIIDIEKSLKDISKTDTLKRASLLFRLSQKYDDKEQSHLGIPYILEAVKLYQEIGEYEKVNDCRISLAESYRILDKPKDGVSILRLVLKDSRINAKQKIRAYNRLAALYDNSKTSVDSVLKYSNKCIEIAKKEKDYKYLALSQNELGYIFFKRIHNLRKAEPFFKEAIKNFSLVNEHRNIINTSINYSNLFIEKKQYEKALMVMNQSFDHLVVDFPSRNTRRMFLQLSKIHRYLGNFKEAVEYLDLANLIERKIYFNQVDAKLFELTTKYDVENKERELANQRKMNDLLAEKAELLRIVIFLLLIVFSALLYLFHIRQKLIKHKQLLAEKERVELKVEVEEKSKELVTKTLKLINQTEFEKSISPKLKEIAQRIETKDKEKLLHICQEIKMNQNETLWNDFEKSFNDVNTSFYNNLKKHFPDLTNNETKLCAFIRLNMNTKDIASMLNISVRGVETARYRLRKKLKLDHDQSIYHFLKQF